MALRMPVVWSERHRLHEPGGEIWVGVRTPGTELPERAERIRAELARRGLASWRRRRSATRPLLAVHDRELLDYLAAAWEDWEAGRADPRTRARTASCRTSFPHPGLFSGFEPAVPAGDQRPRRPVRLRHDDADRAGHVGGGARRAGRGRSPPRTWCSRASRPRTRCCRPPGHHVDPRLLRRLLLPQQRGRRRARACARALGGPVAVIDVDAHHGNGTQRSSTTDPEVLVGSVHVDPGAGWFPHFLGFAERDAAPARARGPTATSAGARHGRRSLAGGGRASWPRWARARAARGPGGGSRRRRGRRRPREPARGDRRPASARPGGRSASSACRPWSSRRAAMTSRRSATLVGEALAGVEDGRRG